MGQGLPWSMVKNEHRFVPAGNFRNFRTTGLEQLRSGNGIQKRQNTQLDWKPTLGIDPQASIGLFDTG